MQLHSKLGSMAYIARAAVAAVCAFGALPAAADRVLLGSDYFHTLQPTMFGPVGSLVGVNTGPGNTDTIVRRQGNCDLVLSTAGSNCTIPIEMTTLSLTGIALFGNPLVRVRESPSLNSTGMMTITSDGSGSGGTFASFFDIFFEVSLNGGTTFTPQGPLRLTSAGTPWTTIEHDLLVDGLIGDGLANRHTNKNTAACPVGPAMRCVDFYLALGGIVTENEPGAVHTATSAVPEPGALALAALGLLLMAGLTRRSLRS